jgi:hypothetical protein
MTDSRPRCQFAVRYPAGDGKWRYQPVDIASPGGGAFVPMTWPPVVGDLISLWDRGKYQPEGGPLFRVVDRGWMHASWGSADWPYGESEPRTGPLVDIIVEPASQGVYRDETPICAEADCEAVWVDGQWWMPPGAGEPGPHDHRAYEGSAAEEAPLCPGT